MDGILVALDAFTCTVDGVLYNVSKGNTVRQGHPLVTGREILFGDYAIDYDYDEPKAVKAAATKAPDKGANS